MAKGWIKIHRKITDTGGYFSETFCRNMAWVDLLLIANFEPNNFRVRGIRVHIRRGQVGYPAETLGRRWRWSRGKVLRFLKELEDEGKIVQQKNTIINLISIVKYASYQNDSTTEDTINGTLNRTADGQQTDSRRYTEKNVKNVKNDKEEKKEARILTFPFDSDSFLEKWNLWKEYKKTEHKFSYKTVISEQAALAHLSEISDGDEKKAIQIILKSIGNGYKGLFKSNETGKAKSGKGGGEDAYQAQMRRFANGD